MKENLENPRFAHFNQLFSTSRMPTAQYIITDFTGSHFAFKNWGNHYGFDEYNQRFSLSPQEPPFVEIKNKSLKREDVAGKVVDGDLQGFLIDLIRALAKEANFEYDLYLRSDSGYQKMIDELTRQVNANAGLHLISSRRVYKSIWAAKSI